MNQTESLAPAQNGQPVAISLGFENADTFALLQRAAKLLSNSTLVPAQYRCQKEIKEYGKVVGVEDNPNATANCVIALNIARRMRADELMVMQNLYVVEGRPSWSSQWVIAAVNTCGKFSPLRFEMTKLGTKEVEYSVTEWENGKKSVRKVKQTIENVQCVAWTLERGTGERLEGPAVSMEMAVQEGWYGKAGSKWQTMPDVMLRYRAASFFGKLYAPELLMGLPTAEEVHDDPVVERAVQGREVPAAQVPQMFANALPPANEESPPVDDVMASETKAGRKSRTAREDGASSGDGLPPAQAFWARCDTAGFDQLAVLAILRDNALTDAEYPADLSDTDAEAAMQPKIWDVLAKLMKGGSL